MKKLKKRFNAVLAMLICISFYSNAQINVVGIVKDDSNEGLPGVNVIIKGSQKGTVTDLNGKFGLSVPEDGTLLFSFIGFESQEVKVGSTKELSILMQSNSKSLNEIVVTGYGGEVKRRDLTGSIAKVEIADITKAPVADFGQALAGRVAGVVVSSSEGMPGGEMNIVIRGNNSITQDNSPLYVVDGFPFENFNSGSLNPSDVESIDILKDASATAIYGARGANGVIIVTTKKGSAGATKVTYDGFVGYNKIIKEMSVLSPYEFVKLQEEMRGYDALKSTYYKNGSTLDYYLNPSKTYDWQKEVYQIARTQSHSVNMSGGTNQSKFNSTLSYYNQDGIIIGSNFNRIQGKINLDNRLFSDKVHINLNLNYSDGNRKGASPANYGSTTSNALMYSVWAYRPVSYDPNQDLLEDNYDPALAGTFDYRFNPIKSVQNEYRVNIDRSIAANGSVQWEILPNLKLKSSGGYNIRSQRNEQFNNANTRSGNPTTILGVNGSVSMNEISSLLNDNTLSYSTLFNQVHSLNALVGVSLQQTNTNYYNMSVKQVSSDIFGMSGFDEGIPNTMGSALSSSALFSYLGRVNYNFKSKYYITASFRADGSSKFSPENRWGYFPSGSLAWTITEEKFMKQIPAISNAKVRSSWGMTGNNRVGDFDYLAKLQKLLGTEYSFDNTTASPSVKMTSLGNPNLKWETTDQTNVGLDLGIFKQRVTFTVDAYKKVTRDLLLNADLPGSAGFLKIYKNIGRIQNQGLEFTLGADLIKSKKFMWNTSFNISFNQSEVLALTDDQEAMLQAVTFSSSYNNSPPYIAKVGQSLGQIYGYIYEGTYKYDDFDKTGSSYSLKANVPSNGIARNLIQPGDQKYRDINGDGQINDLDRTVIGNGTPIHTGGWNNNFVWGNFDLNIFFQWSYGNDIINANRIVMEGTTGFATNQFASFANRWTPTNPTSNIPRAGSQTPSVYSSRVVEDGSFIRLKTLQVGYNVPKKITEKVKLNNLRFYAATQNIFTLTNYSGSDPEVSVRNSALTPGFDYSAYPSAFTFTIGLNTKF